MENLLEFIGNASSALLVGLIASIATSIAIWLINQIGKNKKISKNQEKNASEVITKALDLAELALQGDKPANIRISIFLIEKKQNGLVLSSKFRSSNLAKAQFSELQYEKWQGVAGQAWGYEAPVVGDLTIAESSGISRWGFTGSQKNLITKVKAILVVPIRDRSRGAIIGVLNIESEDPIADYFKTDHVKKIALEIAAQVELLLNAFGLDRLAY